jgi:FtsP/CotA-like multicopper oxidase with cupredoxin domain
LKLVGGDSGRYERETFVESVLLSPSERAVVDVLFETPGEARLEHRTPEHVYDLGAFTVTGAPVAAASRTFDALRTDPELVAERAGMAAVLERAPDKTLAFVASMPLLYGEAMPEASAYTCPMHPEIVSDEPGSCPICGMRLMPVAAPTSYVCPMHPEVTAEAPGRCPICGMKLVPAQGTHGHDHDHGEDHAHQAMAHGEHPPMAHGAMDHGAHGHEPSHDVGMSDGLEWEDLMPEINRASDTTNMQWKLIDRATGDENHAITWAFTVGDRVKVRLVNEMDSDHPMHHPFHVHGAGRFLILARDGVTEENLAWKDTVLIRAGETVDILLDVTNPGRWMAHCHIAEHTEAGMMFSFDVAPAG